MFKKKEKIPEINKVESVVQKYPNLADVAETSETTNMNWEKNYLVFESDIKHQIAREITVYFYFLIYAIIDFLLHMSRPDPIDEAFSIMCIPLLWEIFTSFRTIEKFAKAMLKSLILIVGIIFPLLSADIITVNGVIFLSPLLGIFDFWQLIFPTNPIVTPTSVALESIVVVAGIFTILSILLFIFVIIRPKEKVEYIISDKALYIKKRMRKPNIVDILLLLKNIIFDLLNIKKHVDAYRKFKAFALVKTEKGLILKHDFVYGRIPFESITKVTTTKSVSQREFIYSIVFIILGILIPPVLIIGFQLFMFNLFYMIIYEIFMKVNKKAIHIKLRFKRSKITGAWRYTNTEDQMIMFEMKKEIADKINSICGEIKTSN